MMTGFGLGWVNAAADYSRYLPRTAGSGAVVGWTTLGGALAPVLLVVFGLLLAGSSAELSEGIAADPIGALTTVLPTWFLIPFALVAVLGLVGGAVLDIYSSGLALLSAGLKVPRYVAAGIDGVLMILGAIYVVFFATDFLGPFQGFLITLGVPIAAWCGVFVAEVLLRRRNYAEADLYDPRGRYGSVRWTAVVLVVVGTFLGWGLVTNTFAGWLGWQGYLLGPLGGREGAWAFANLGVLVSLLVGFLGTLLCPRSAIRAQESVLRSEPALAGRHRPAGDLRRPGQRLAYAGVRPRRRGDRGAAPGVRRPRGLHPVRRAGAPDRRLGRLLRRLAFRPGPGHRPAVRPGAAVRRPGRAGGQCAHLRQVGRRTWRRSWVPTRRWS